MNRKIWLAALGAVALVAGDAVAAPSPMTREEIETLAKYGVGYSYWWGHGRWNYDGQNPGSCSGSCPNCTHTGSYGADCSGFVAKAWQVPSDSPITTNAHPYSTYNFYNESTHWSDVSMSSLELSDAAVYRSGGSGHIVLFEKYGSSGQVWTYEARGCSYGIVHNQRTLSSSYKGIRRDNLSTEPPPPPDPMPEEVTVMSAITAEVPVTPDVNGDGFGDLCARAAAGFRCYLSTGDSFGPIVSTAELSNDAGFSGIGYYSTIRLGDVNGDGKSDVCARAADGMHCWLADASGFGTKIDGPPLRDDSGWNAVEHYSTIRMGDINGDGKQDICARANARFLCWLSDGMSVTTQIDGPELSDAAGWDKIEYFSTIRLVDVDADSRADVCARTPAGFRCWLSNGQGFPTEIGSPEMADSGGWNKPQYYWTLRMADVNGDGRMDACARAAAGFGCLLGSDSGFSDHFAISGHMSDSAGWNELQYYSTIRMADINGDGKADVCGRASSGMVCYLADGTSFGERVTGPAWADSTGWNKPEYYRTIRVVDYDGNGKDDLCARGSLGVFCYPSTGEGFGQEYDGPDLADDVGWKGLQYYSTIRTASLFREPPAPCVPVQETCDGQDNDCDGVVDNGLNCGSTEDAGAQPPDAEADAEVDASAAQDASTGTQDAVQIDADDEEEVEQRPAAAQPATSDDGCSCRTAGHSDPAAWLALTALAAAATARRRRR